jgi:D-ribose pyranose/furanose isomerase RbsD
MRSHRCEIDLKTDKLVFPDSDIKISFLSDGEIKKNKHLEEEEIGEQYEKMHIDIDIENAKHDSFKDNVKDNSKDNSKDNNKDK